MTTDSTIALEMEVGRRHSPGIAWPTIRLAIGVYAGLGLSIWAALSGTLPYWACGVINAVILYGTYTVIHEATHDNIVPRNVRLKWMNAFFGHAICVVLWMFFRPHKKSHMVHHARANFDDDPDIYARGAFGVVTFWRTPLGALGHFNPFVLHRDCVKYSVPMAERRNAYLTFAAYTAVTAAIIAAGYGVEFLVLWFVPWLIGYTTMLFFFTWVPHHSHIETGRYRDTRCSIWPGANFLTQGQHMHLIHHMMPWIPYYDYEKVFYEIRPCLEQNNAQIDGFWPRAS